MKDDDKSDFNEIYNRFLNSDEEKYFKELYVHHYSNVYKMVKGIVADGVVAKDIVDETWLKVLEKKSKLLDDYDSFCGYLFTIAKNEACQYLRKSKWIDRNESDLINNQPDRSQIKSNDEELIFENEDLKKVVRQFLMKLKSNYQDIVLKYYISDMSTKEIAKELHLTDGNVRVQLHRARKKLIKLVNKFVK